MAEEEDRHATGRSTSPYHKKCFPPYCDNAALIDKQAISKLERDDLEDKFIVYADENIAIKKQLRDQERQIQRLQTALARQDNIDKKGGMKVPASMHYDSSRIDYLESQNKSLSAKVKVLKQQLLNHSYIHSKENKIAEMREKQLKSHSPDQSYREFPQSAREGKSYSPRRSHRETAAGDVSNTALKERIAVLEQLLESQKEKYKNRIAQLEKSLSLQSKGDKDELSVHSRRVSDNVDMIKLLRLNQEHTVKISTLEEEHEVAMKDIAELQAALKQASATIDDLQIQLERERGKSRDVQGQLTKSVSHSETIRALEEQVRDLQNERKTLKETNEQLLQLTTGPQSKSDRSLQETKLKQQISTLERSLQDKIKDLEEKQEQLITMETLLQQTTKPTQISSNTNNCGPANGCLNCKQLKEQLCDAMLEKQELQQQIENYSQNKEAQKEIDELNSKMENSLQEIERLQRELQHKESGNVREQNDLEERLKQAVTELDALRPVASQHKACIQDGVEKKKLEDKLNSALQEIDELKAELESKGKTVTPCASKTLSKKTIERVNAVDVDYADLKDKLCTALLENEELRSKFGDGNQHLDVKNDELLNKLLQSEKELALLRPLAADHEHCWQTSEEKKELDEKLNKALLEIDYLKYELGQRELVPKSISSKSTEEISKTPSKTSEKVSPVPSKRLDKESEKSLVSIGRTSRITFRSPEHISVKSLENTTSKSNEMDCGDLKEKLCNALIENQMLRKQLGDNDKDREYVKENEDLARQLRAALAEVQELRDIASLHRQCRKPPSPTTSAVHSVPSAPSASSQSIVPEVGQRKWPEPKKLMQFSKSKEAHIMPSRVRLMSLNSPEEEDGEFNKETKVTTAKTNVLNNVGEELTPSLECVKRLLQNRRAVQREAPEGPATPQQETPGGPTPSSQTLREDEDEEELVHQQGVTRKIEISQLNQSHNISKKINQKSVAVLKPCGYDDIPTQDYKWSTEVQNMSYSNQSLKEVHSDPGTQSRTQVTRFDPSKTAVVKCQPKEDVLNVCLEQGSKRTVAPTLSHYAEQVPLEPRQQPVLVIVSKHEFDSILLNKKKFFSKSEALLPVQDNTLYNCRMDICVHDLELDNHLIDQLSNLERNPQVYMVWSFLGYDQRTVSMPATNAQFCTALTYLGPVTEPMVQHVKEKELMLELMLERMGTRDMLVAEGHLDLMPAFDQPSRGFVRPVPLHSNLGGLATAYVSFKLHECCESEAPPPVPNSLEVGIGSLRLNSNNNQPTVDATHLYVEYSMLGFCGPELETESMPRSEVIRFNHTKRLRVNDNNSNKLDPLLSPEDTQYLRFNIIAEPCSLDNATDVQQIGHAEVNLLKDMVDKEEDIISKPVAVYNNDGQVVGNLSVTIIGISTLQNKQKSMRQA